MNNVAFVQYYFDSGIEKPFIVKRHGNAVHKSAPYKSTNASTKAFVRELIVDKPKTIHTNLTKGVEKANEMATSCSRQAIYDINRSKKKGNLTSTTNTMNFYDIIAMIREQDSQKNTENRFIRYVCAYPDQELLVLGYDSQFHDLDRFCTSPVNFSILSVDPTFSLGAFYVTPTSYENLFLVSNRTKKHPTFLGPVLISHNLDESCYSHLTFVITQKSPLLEENLIAYGTDGEKALYNQFGKKFKNAVHVRCIGHFRENCKTHLKGVSLENQTKILKYIFGKDIEGTHYGGLIDCESEDIFTASLNSLIDVWKTIVPESFITWFKSTIPAIHSSMLAPVREKAGLGKPPRPFYDNQSESVNHIIKEGVEYKNKICQNLFCRCKTLFPAKMR